MFSNLIVAALAGAAIAYTPPNFLPSSSQNLTVAFGSTLAIDGREIVKAETANAPTVGTSSPLTGTFALMMVDPDIPPSANSTNQLLHWLQTGLVSSTTPVVVAGVSTYPLINPSNVSAIASYRPPNPPARLPLSHRYVQLLINITANTSVLNGLSTYSTVRTNFSAEMQLGALSLGVLRGNWFNVTNTTGLPNATATSSGSAGSSATATSTRAPGFTGAAVAVGEHGAWVAGLGALVAGFAML